MQYVFCMKHSALTGMTQLNNQSSRGLLIILLMLSLLMSSRAIFKEECTQLRISDRNNDDYFVRITGDVMKPGIYSFSETVNIDELIKISGGLKTADQLNPHTAGLNLKSGAWINVEHKNNRTIFSQKEIAAFHRVTLGIPIDINRESVEGLTAVPGIGNVLASRIVDERARKNGFNDLNEIKRVHGIGDRLYERILQYVSIH